MRINSTLDRAAVTGIIAMKSTSILNVIAVAMGSLALRLAFSSGATLKIDPATWITGAETMHHEFWESSSPRVGIRWARNGGNADERHIGDVVAKL
jgi:hypothetical protein